MLRSSFGTDLDEIGFGIHRYGSTNPRGGYDASVTDFSGASYLPYSSSELHQRLWLVVQLVAVVSADPRLGIWRTRSNQRGPQGYYRTGGYDIRYLTAAYITSKELIFVLL